MKCTLQPIGGGIFSGPLEGHDKPRLDVFVGPHDDGKYTGLWEVEEHIDGTRSHILYGSGVLYPTDDGYSGEIVSVRRGKVRGWRATARKGSAVVEFAPI